VSTPRRPRSLGRAGGKLWDEIVASVAEGWRLDGRDEALLLRACQLADTAEALQADVAAQGRVVPGSMGQPTLHPGIREIRATTTAIAAVLAKVELRPPAAKTGPDEQAPARPARRRALSPLAEDGLMGEAVRPSRRSRPRTRPSACSVSRPTRTRTPARRPSGCAR
jgi:hypothetical protein